MNFVFIINALIAVCFLIIVIPVAGVDIHLIHVLVQGKNESDFVSKLSLQTLVQFKKTVVQKLGY